MGMTFTTEFPWDEEELAQVESWCHHHLRGPWHLYLRDVADDPAKGLAWGWSTLYGITVDTPEDHALVRLTWL